MNGVSYDGLFAVAGGTYLLMVIYQGNFWALYNQLLQEKGYLEFLVACMVLSYVKQNDQTGLATPLIALGVLAAAIKYATNFNFGSALADFGSGRKSLFQTIGAMVP